MPPSMTITAAKVKTLAQGSGHVVVFAVNRKPSMKIEIMIVTVLPTITILLSVVLVLVVVDGVQC